MFAQHLPPSAARPRVLALDEPSAQALPPDVEVVRDRAAPGPFDAIVGQGAADALGDWFQRLRPGGRLILADAPPAEAAPEAFGAERLQALTAAGFIHCLVHVDAPLTLCRGERPPLAAARERVRATADAAPASPASPFVFLLIQQSPNKPAWRLTPGEALTWQAATVVDPATGRTALLGFTSLVKAVAFMQPAVLAGFLTGVNKVGQFPSAVAMTWDPPVLVNPRFEDWRSARLGPWAPVDPQAAVTGVE